MSAIILAGGGGRRLGMPKPLVELHGRPLISYVLEAALKVAEEIIVVSGRGVSKALRDILPGDVELLEDLEEGYGPLMGLYTGLTAAHKPYALALPCDSPLLRVEVLRHLLERVEGFDAAIPRWPNGYLEPLHAAYRVETSLRACRESLMEGRRELRAILRHLNRVLYISTEELRALDPQLQTFHNINTPEELERIEEIIAVGDGDPL